MGQGFINIFRNKLFSLASIATISICLFLLGIFYAILINFQFMVKGAQEGVSITVFFNVGTTEQRIDEISTLIKRRGEVSKVVYVSAEEAWESFKGTYLGEYSDGFTENPLADSSNLEVYLSDVSMQAALVSFLESVEDVRRINQSELTADTLSGLNILIGYTSAAIILILLGVSVFLISNTVTMGISVRREEIAIMKYIGATDFFVRAPFVFEGIIIGLIGSIPPLLIIYYAYNHLVSYIAERFTILSGLIKFLPIEQILTLLIPICVGLGVGIGFFGSISTVRKHLRV